MVKSRESIIFVMYSALNMIWTYCEVYWALDLNPLKTSAGQPVASGGFAVWLGGYFLDRLIIFVFVDFRVFCERFVA